MRWRRWAELSEVERVDLYTRQSLYVFLWLTVGFMLLTTSQEAPVDSRAFGALVVGAVLLAACGTAVMRDVFALYPAHGPLPWRSMALYVVVAAVVIALAVGQDDALRGGGVMSVFLTAAWSFGGLRDPRAAVVVVVLLAALPAVASGEPLFFLGGVAMALFFVFTVRVSPWLLGVVTELDAARQAQAALAVAEERLRFSRDLHDVLGRRLSTIAVQAELAATLADRGDERAAERMLEVRGVAHEALREAREIARGYRPTDLAQELEGARSLLRSAGITARVDVDDLPAGWHEAAGWVVREAVTNVLRHSSASEVVIGWQAPELTVVNDGARPSSGPGGSGLAGLRERLAPLGAGLDAGQDGTTYRLLARLPGAGPAEGSS